jgi:hypothetical protein
MNGPTFSCLTPAFFFSASGAAQKTKGSSVLVPFWGNDFYAYGLSLCHNPGEF